MKKVFIIGAGLSGLISAYLLKKDAKSPINIVVFEKGLSFEKRLSSQTPNLVSGTGGAGTLFGGKFCYPPASSGIWKKTLFSTDKFESFEKDCITPFLGKISENKNNKSFCPSAECIDFQTGLLRKEYVSYLVTKDELNNFVVTLVNKLEAMNVKINNECIFKGFEKKSNGYIVSYSNNNENKIIKEQCDCIIFSTGRDSAKIISNWLSEITPLTLSNPDLGLRLSMPLKDIEAFNCIGKDVKVKKRFGDISVRTFCVCSGGNKAEILMNGFSYYDGHFDNKLTKTVNLGILARDKNIKGFEAVELYCNSLKKYLYSDFTLKDFLKHSEKLITSSNMFDNTLLAVKSFILLLQKKGIIGSDSNHYPLWLPSVDNLNLKVEIDSNCETKTKNVYVVGDATGLSRGFIQSLWSSYCACQNILQEFNYNNGVQKLEMCTEIKNIA